MSKIFLSLCSETWSRSDSPVSSFHADSRRQSGDRVRSRRSEQRFSVAESGRSNGSVKEFRFDPVCFPFPGADQLGCPAGAQLSKLRYSRRVAAPVLAKAVCLINFFITVPAAPAKTHFRNDL